MHTRLHSLPLKKVFPTAAGREWPPYRLELELSLPRRFPAEGRNTVFGEHVYDAATRRSTPEVIFLGRGCVVVSTDNGDTWGVAEVPGVGRRALYNCFTRADGFHLVQVLPEKKAGSPVVRADLGDADPVKPAVYLCDRGWNVLSCDESPASLWHGTCSIDEGKDGTVMFAEYPANNGIYQPEDSPSRGTVIPARVMRSCDGGRTFEPVFEVGPDVVRHFHTLRADPWEKDVWWLSSGDRASECRVWRSADNGGSWVDVTNPTPGVPLTKMYRGREQAVFRYTDLIIDEETLFWGTDDILGDALEFTQDMPVTQRTGSRLFTALKSENPLRPTAIGYCGHPVRKLIDLPEAIVVITEANRGLFPLRPQVFILFKDDPSQLHKVCELDNFRNFATGFTYSKGSRAALNNRFFTYRRPHDVFNGVWPWGLQWTIRFLEEE
jgi:hypothetical protein